MSRLLAFLTVVSTVVLPAILWFWLSALHGKIEDIPMGYVGFVTAACATTLAMFAANKRAE